MLNTRRSFLFSAASVPLVAQVKLPVVTEPLATREFLELGRRAYRMIRQGSDHARIRDARVEVSSAFRSAFSPEIKRYMESILRSDNVWWQPADLGQLFRNYDIDLGSDDQVREIFTPDIRMRSAVIAELDSGGIDGLLFGIARGLHPDRSRFEDAYTLDFILRPDPYDVFEAAAGVLGAGLGVASIMGCVVCGPAAVGVGLALGILRVARVIAGVGK